MDERKGRCYAHDQKKLTKTVEVVGSQDSMRMKVVLERQSWPRRRRRGDGGKKIEKCSRNDFFLFVFLFALVFMCACTCRVPHPWYAPIRSERTKHNPRVVRVKERTEKTSSTNGIPFADVFTVAVKLITAYTRDWTLVVVVVVAT